MGWSRVIHLCKNATWVVPFTPRPDPANNTGYFGGAKGVLSQVKPGHLGSDLVFWYEKGIIGTLMYNT